MTKLVQCDNCGKTIDLGILTDIFAAWYTTSTSGGAPERHFHNLDCLREWFSPEACAARRTKLDAA